MTQYLPPNLLLLFQPRPPIAYLPPVEKPTMPAYSGVAQFITQFEDPATVDYTKFRPIETKEQQRERKRKERQDVEDEKIEKIKAACMSLSHCVHNYFMQCILTITKGTLIRALKQLEMLIRLYLFLVWYALKLMSCF